MLTGLLLSLLLSQTQIDLATQAKNADFSAQAFTIPNKTGTSLPGTCTVGSTFFKTNATAGQNLYLCSSTNTWTQIAGGGGGSGTVSSVGTTAPLTGGPITDTGSVACPTCGVTGSPLSQFAATTSAQLRGVLSDETGTGLAVFGTAPVITLPNATGLPLATGIADFDMHIASQALTIGSLCAVSSPCLGRFNAATVSVTNVATATLSGGGTGTAMVYLDTDGIVNVTTTSLALSCSHCSVQALAAIPDNSIPIGQWTATGGAWDASGYTNYRALLSQKVVLPGTGLLTTEAPGSTTVLADTSVLALLSNPLSQFASTTSAQLAGVISNETGSGLLVFGTSPTLVTPTIGAATATTVNNLAITTQASSPTLAIGSGKTFIVANTLQLSGTDGTTMTFPGASATITQTIASGATALGTSAIASGACATVVTATATGTASTDAISWTPNASIKAVTGYVPGTSGGLSIAAYPGSGTVNFDVCNWTSGSITPGAVTINWRVTR